MLLTRMIYDDASFDKGERTWSVILIKYKKKREILFISRVSRIFSPSLWIESLSLIFLYTKEKKNKIRERQISHNYDRRIPSFKRTNQRHSREELSGKEAETYQLHGKSENVATPHEGRRLPIHNFPSVRAAGVARDGATRRIDQAVRRWRKVSFNRQRWQKTPRESDSIALACGRLIRDSFEGKREDAKTTFALLSICIFLQICHRERIIYFRRPWRDQGRLESIA